MQLGEPELNRLTDAIIGLAMRVHSAFGPGLFEKVYEAALCHELIEAGYKCLRQQGLPVFYKGVLLADIGYVVDLIVDDQVIVELKCVRALEDIHVAQTLTYMRLSGIGCGLLINFHGTTIKGNIKRLLL